MMKISIFAAREKTLLHIIVFDHPDAKLRHSHRVYQL